MLIFEYGNLSADNILIQMVDEHDLELIENEVALISEETDRDFKLIAIKADNWNKDLSPWEAEAVFGKEGFGAGAEDTLLEIQNICKDRSKTYYIGGYSLAGLFALWVAYQTDLFRGVAAASPSIWFPDFVEFMKEKEILSKTVYLSLGDKEEKTKNPVMAKVGEKIKEAYEHLKSMGVDCTLEWNQGNHFKDADIRTAKAFSWVLNKKA